MKRVLLVTGIFPPVIGGPATFMENFAYELSSLGYKVTVVCASEVEFDGSDSKRPFRICRMSIANRYRYEMAVPLRLFWEVLRHNLIFVNGLEPYFALANRFLRKRYILKVVGDTVWERARNLGITTLDIDAFQIDEPAKQTWSAMRSSRTEFVLKAARVVTPSVYLQTMVYQWGAPKEQVEVVFNGIEDALISLRRPLPRAEEPLSVLFVGRLTNWKGVETLLIAAARVDNVTFVIAGDGPEHPMLSGMSRQLGLDGRVRFAGRLSKQQVFAEMERAHVLVLTSLYEGMSHTLIEAQAFGLPCIASRCGGNHEVVIENVTGLLIPPQNPAALTEALIRLRDNENFRQKMASAAQDRARQFHLSDSVKRLVSILEDCG